MVDARKKRKTWKTIHTAPDPFAAGTVYVTQQQTGFWYTDDGGDFEDPGWTPLPSDAEPVTRVQRCRLHANGRLENTDVAPKEIPSAHVVSIDAPTITELGKLVARELDFREDQEEAERARRRSEALTRLSAERASEEPVLSDDGKTLNWKGVNYVLQQDGGETVTESLPFYSDAPKDSIVKESPWLSDEVPMPPVQALGVLRSWMTGPVVRVAVLGGGNAYAIRSRFKDLLDQEGGENALGADSLVWTGNMSPMRLTFNRKSTSLELTFFGADHPGMMRGRLADHFLVESSVVEDRPQDALQNLQLMLMGGDNPSGIVLDKF